MKAPKVNLPRWSSVKKMVYDGETNKICSRKPHEWGQLCLLYLFVYSFVAIFFSSFLLLILKTQIPDDRPKLTGEQSILKLEPDLNWHPRLDVTSSLIQLDKGLTERNRKFAKVVSERLKLFENFQGNRVCDSGLNDPQIPCRFDTTVLGDCKESNADFTTKFPCMYLGINKVYGYLPSISDGTSIRLKCTGKEAIDTANLGDPVYFPSVNDGNATWGILDAKFFPFIIQPGYQSPLVAVQFPNAKPKVMIRVQCTAENLKTHKPTTGFEYLMESS